MAGTIDRKNPTPEIVFQLQGAGTGGATGALYHGLVTVSVPFPQDTVTSTGTGNAGALSWINPEAGSIRIVDISVRWNNATSTGTGTFDMGVGTNGTGSLDTIFDGATMDKDIRAYGSAAFHTTLAASAGLVSVWTLGPGGTGGANSLVAKTSEPTSTAKGRVYITYVNTGT